MKACKGCHEVKDESEFYASGRGKNGLNPKCKTCVDAYVGAWKKQNRAKITKQVKWARGLTPDKYRTYWLKSKYGITSEQWDEIAARQDYKCAICGKEETRRSFVEGTKYQHLVVDHDHVSGKVRGLICHKCNIVIAFIGEDLTVLHRVESYLLQYRI